MVPGLVRSMPRAAPPDRRVIVFDLGGVVVRWTDEWLFARVARELRLPLARVRRAMLRTEDPLEAGRIGLGEFWDRVSRSLRSPIPPAVRRLWVGLFRSRARLRRDLVAWIGELRRAGRAVACFSNTDPDHVRVIRARGWLEPFAPAILSYRIGAVKPARRAFDRARRALRRRGSEIFFLDDRAENAAAARRAGWSAVRFVSTAQARRAVARWSRARQSS